jgi:NhaC family Na+:H+ antiporter
MTESVLNQRLSPIAATGLLLSLFGWLLLGLFALSLSLHALLLTSLGALVVFGRLLGIGIDELRGGLFQGIQDAIPALVIFLMIGVLMASFMLSGTVPSLLYYGLYLLSPEWFAPATLILCAVMSSATGTSWGTVATLGVALIGLGQVFGLSPALIAGAAIAGASFGDKMSPISDTTNLAALSTGTDLYRHIRSMSLTTMPTFLISCIVITLIGYQSGEQTLPPTAVNALSSALETEFNLSALTLTPIALMAFLAIRRIPAEITMFLTSVYAMALAIGLQDAPLSQVMAAVYDGTAFETGQAALDTLLSRGGIASMAWTLTLALIAVALGGVLRTLGIFEVLVTTLIKRLQSRGALVTTSTLGSTMGNALLTEPYIVIILTGQLFRDAYGSRRYDTALLSRSIEEGSTLTAALIPWTTTGIFYASTLGLSVLDYAPYAVLNWLNLIVGITFAWLGWGLIKDKSTAAVARAPDI